MHFPFFTNPECQNTKPSPSQGWSRSMRVARCSDMPGQTPTQSLMKTHSNYLPELHCANLLWEIVWLSLVFNCVVKAYWFNFPFSYINNNFDGGNRTKLLPYKFMGKKKQKQKQKPNQPTNKQTPPPHTHKNSTKPHTHTNPPHHPISILISNSCHTKLKFSRVILPHDGMLISRISDAQI